MKINVTLDAKINPKSINPKSIGSLHNRLALATFPDGTTVELTSGFGCGHTMIYGALNGKRVLQVDSEPFLCAIIDAVIATTRKVKK